MPIASNHIHKLQSTTIYIRVGFLPGGVEESERNGKNWKKLVILPCEFLFLNAGFLAHMYGLLASSPQEGVS